MSLKGSEKDYRFGQKNNWRRTAWNQVVERSKHNGGRVVLYLPGPDDLDREVAKSKGINDQDLIAIDRDVDNAEAMRLKRVPVLNAEAEEVLNAWPDDVPVRAVMLDMFRGIGIDSAVWIYEALYLKKCFSRSVVMLNLQRGRDVESNQFREIIDIDPAAYERACVRNIHARHVSDLSVSRLNRAVMELNLRLLCHADHILKMTHRHGDPGLVALELWRRAAPCFYSYKSGHLVFDSVVFNNIGMSSVLTEAYPGQLKEYIAQAMGIIRAERTSQSVTRSIAAMLAIRTRRMSGTLPVGVGA